MNYVNYVFRWLHNSLLPVIVLVRIVPTCLPAVSRPSVPRAEMLSHDTHSPMVHPTWQPTTLPHSHSHSPAGGQGIIKSRKHGNFIFASTFSRNALIHKQLNRVSVTQTPPASLTPHPTPFHWLPVNPEETTQQARPFKSELQMRVSFGTATAALLLLPSGGWVATICYFLPLVGRCRYMALLCYYMSHGLVEVDG